MPENKKDCTIEILPAVWLVQTDELFEEILNNSGTEILRMPLQILLGILKEVAQRASEINDVELNKLMIRLALYGISDYKDKEHYNIGKAMEYVYGKEA